MLRYCSSHRKIPSQENSDIIWGSIYTAKNYIFRLPYSYGQSLESYSKSYGDFWEFFNLVIDTHLFSFCFLFIPAWNMGHFLPSHCAPAKLVLFWGLRIWAWTIFTCENICSCCSFYLMLTGWLFIIYVSAQTPSQRGFPQHPNESKEPCLKWNAYSFIHL